VVLGSSGQNCALRILLGFATGNHFFSLHLLNPNMWTLFSFMKQIKESETYLNPF